MLRKQERSEQLKQALQDKENEQKNPSSKKPRGILSAEVERAKYKLQLAGKSDQELQTENERLQIEMQALIHNKESFNHFCGTFGIMHKRHIENQLADVSEETDARKAPALKSTKATT
jgi:hypothetical protein